MEEHRDRLEKNPRIGMVYKNWDKQEKTLQEQTLQQATYYLNNLEAL